MSLSLRHHYIVSKTLPYSLLYHALLKTHTIKSQAHKLQLSHETIRDSIKINSIASNWKLVHDLLQLPEIELHSQWK